MVRRLKLVLFALAVLPLALCQTGFSFIWSNLDVPSGRLFLYSILTFDVSGLLHGDQAVAEYDGMLFGSLAMAHSPEDDQFLDAWNGLRQYAQDAAPGFLEYAEDAGLKLLEAKTSLSLSTLPKADRRSAVKMAEVKEEVIQELFLEFIRELDYSEPRARHLQAKLDALKTVVKKNYYEAFVDKPKQNIPKAPIPPKSSALKNTRVEQAVNQKAQNTSTSKSRESRNEAPKISKQIRQSAKVPTAPASNYETSKHIPKKVAKKHQVRSVIIKPHPLSKSIDERKEQGIKLSIISEDDAKKPKISTSIEILNSDETANEHVEVESIQLADKLFTNEVNPDRDFKPSEEGHYPATSQNEHSLDEHIREDDRKESTLDVRVIGLIAACVIIALLAISYALLSLFLLKRPTRCSITVQDDSPRKSAA